MKNIDQLIRESLREEDAALYDDFVVEQTMFKGASDLFRGKNRWLAIGTLGAILGLTVVSIWMAVRFFQATQTRELLIWGMGFMLCAVGGIGLKIWTWIEMSKNVLLREIKHLELQVAVLATRQGLSSKSDA